MNGGPVLILFCEEGDGHARAARVLADELQGAGVETTVVDALKGGMGRLVPLLSRDAYRLQLRWLRWTYGLEVFLFTRVPPARWLARSGLAFFAARPLLRLIRRHDPSLVVSTHPAVTNVLGTLRRRGRLDVPTVATVTDFGVHALWANRGIDLHLVMHERCLPAVERVAGSGSARVVDALVGAEFRFPLSRAEARAALGLPAASAVALISGGGWGVGDVAAAVEAALEVTGLTVVCLSGRNALLHRRLEQRFGGNERLRIVPFTDRMHELIAAADVLVDSSVGMTCLEALSVGRPVIAFGSPPGHSRRNARALEALGLADRARSESELTELLSVVAPNGDGQQSILGAAPRPADATLAASLRVARQRRRRPALIAFAAMLGALVLSGWSVASPTPYPVLAKALDLEALKSVHTPARDVALIVAAPPADIPRLARQLAGHGLRASFAVSREPSARARAEVASLRDALLPAASPPRTPGVATIRFSQRLRTLARQLGVDGRFYYLRPDAFTLADDLAARAAGGRPVAATVELGRAAAALDVGPGQIVVVEVAGSSAPASLTALVHLLSARGLRGVSLAELLDSAASTRATVGERARESAPPPASRRPATSPASRQASAGHSSRASSGASATGTNVVSASTIGAT